MLLSEGQMSDYKGAALMFASLPRAKAMIADKGYDGDWFRQALAARKTVRASRQNPTGRSPYPTTPTSIASDITLKTCSES